jgi:hypothetical protein
MLRPIYMYRMPRLRISGRTRLLFSIHVSYYRGLCEATTGFQSFVAKLTDASDPSYPALQLPSSTLRSQFTHSRPVVGVLLLTRPRPDHQSVQWMWRIWWTSSIGRYTPGALSGPFHHGPRDYGRKKQKLLTIPKATRPASLILFFLCSRKRAMGFGRRASGRNQSQGRASQLLERGLR